MVRPMKCSRAIAAAALAAVIATASGCMTVNCNVKDACRPASLPIAAAVTIEHR
jgi:hypothetical protein